MKDAIHHLKHIQKKVVQSARREEALLNRESLKRTEVKEAETPKASKKEARLSMQRATPRLSVR